MKRSSSTFTLALAALFLAPPAPAATPAAPSPSAIPVETFFENPILWSPILSPSGDWVAVLMRAGGRRQLAVIDTATLKKVVVVASFDSTDVGNARWVDDNRLVFEQEFENGFTMLNQRSGLFAVDRDGGHQRRLIRADGNENQETGSHIKERTLTSDNEFLRALDDNSGDIIVEQSIWDDAVGGTNRYHPEVLYTVPRRLDTRTGVTHGIVEGPVPPHARQWIIDGLGRVQGVVTRSGGELAFLSPVAGGTWREIARFKAYSGAPGSFDSISIGVDGSLYVTRAGEAAGRTKGLYRLDTASGKPESEPMVSVKGFDFEGDLVEDACSHKVAGIHYASDAHGTLWLDPAMTAVQAKVDARLPGRVNRIDIASCGHGAPVLVTSSSDHTPAQFFLYGAADDNLRSIAVSRPAIDPRQMADTDFFRIKARDGREFPVYVTKPHGQGPWPTVVLVHGGPNLRGWYWEWDAESQFLASRGYLVVKPEFRGSSGYGDDLLTAGFRQWGLTMQDDIADATRWAAAQGLADPKRTCIAGGSYGGYATLMGLARYPELYRCGVARSAVADLDLMYETWWSDLSDDWKGYGLPVTLGDRVKDAAQLAATSPVKLAARITQPLLLEHGALDRRVPIEQANAMHSALQSSHSPVTWAFYPEEGHGFFIQKDRADFFRREEAFLAANIGQGAAPAVAAGAASTPLY